MHQVKKSKKKPILLAILGIIVVLALCVIFFVPINNAIRSATGNDTPTDTVVKDQLVKRIKANKTGQPQHDANVDKYADKLSDTKMATIMNAAKTEQGTAKLLNSSTTLGPQKSQRIAKEMFTNDKYEGLRTAMSNGNWVQAYNQYQKLSKDGSLTELRSGYSE